MIASECGFWGRAFGAAGITLTSSWVWSHLLSSKAFQCQASFGRGFLTPFWPSPVSIYLSELSQRYFPRPSTRSIRSIPEYRWQVLKRLSQGNLRLDGSALSETSVLFSF